jgi:hypothetical protein
MNRVRGGRGVLEIDNRVSGGKLEQFHTLTCSHCNGIVILNSARQRERAFCWLCNAYICDNCKVTGACTPVAQALELASSGFEVDPFSIVKSTADLAARAATRAY